MSEKCCQIEKRWNERLFKTLFFWLNFVLPLNQWKGSTPSRLQALALGSIAFHSVRVGTLKRCTIFYVPILARKLLPWYMKSPSTGNKLTNGLVAKRCYASYITDFFTTSF